MCLSLLKTVHVYSSLVPLISVFLSPAPPPGHAGGVDTAVIVGVVVAVVIVILLLILAVITTVLVCMKRKVTGESWRG